MAILADVAPYSREYNTYRQIVGKEAEGNTELEIEYEKILNRVKQTRESVIKMTDRHFTAPSMRSPVPSRRFLRQASSSRNFLDADSSSPPCPPAPPICRRGSWVNTRSLVLPHTKTLARARSKPSPRFSVASGPVSALISESGIVWFSLSLRTQKFRAPAPGREPSSDPCRDSFRRSHTLA